MSCACSGYLRKEHVMDPRLGVHCCIIIATNKALSGVPDLWAGEISSQGRNFPEKWDSLPRGTLGVPEILTSRTQTRGDGENYPEGWWTFASRGRY